MTEHQIAAGVVTILALLTIGMLGLTTLALIVWSGSVLLYVLLLALFGKGFVI